MIKTITKTTYISDEGFSFTFEPIEETLKITKTKTGFVAKYLTQDNNPENPFDNSEGNGIFYHWKDMGKEELEKYCELLGYDPDTREIIGKEDKDAVRIDKYEHSGITYSVEGEGRNCRWDTSHSWAVWYPDKVLLDELKGLKGTARRNKCVEYARQMCELFNQWNSGDCYLLVKEIFNKDKEQIDQENVGGYFGYNEALKGLKNDI